MSTKALCHTCLTPFISGAHKHAHGHGEYHRERVELDRAGREPGPIWNGRVESNKEEDT